MFALLNLMKASPINMLMTLTMVSGKLNLKVEHIFGKNDYIETQFKTEKAPKVFTFHKIHLYYYQAFYLYSKL